MPYRLLRLRVGLIQPGVAEPNQAPDAWAVYGRAQDDGKAAVVERALGFEAKLRKEGLSEIKYFLEVAANGRPIEASYDSKKCHHVCEVSHHGKSHKIWRTRRGQIRLIFFYGHGRELIVCDVVKKFEDKFTRAELNGFKGSLTDYLDAAVADKIERID